MYIHTHKKQKNSLETRDELAVLHTDIESQATLELILPYFSSKYKHQNVRLLRLFAKHHLTFLCY